MSDIYITWIRHNYDNINGTCVYALYTGRPTSAYEAYTIVSKSPAKV